mmetsp:Transcript_24550/g.72841  ORF Transcript_24550/g.72841 Transcript_24550/m.72841 type:complete len:356 (+) Transcript_24550:262-1329(+)
MSDLRRDDDDRRARSRSRSPARGGGGGGRGGKATGIACRWNERGFGFIKPDDGSDDIFCHLSAIRDGNMLREGDSVRFEKQYDASKGKDRALNVYGGVEGEDPRDKRGGGGGFTGQPRPGKSVGTAMRWNLDKGYGFIKQDDGGEDLFVHMSEVKDGQVLREGDRVEYTKAFDERKGKDRAVDVYGGCEAPAPAAGGYGGGYSGGGAQNNKYGGVGGGGSSTDLCYKCNQTGHWARNCPNAAGGGGRGGGYNSGGFGGGGGKKGGCFKCGLDGHWASNCPNVGGGGGGGGWSRSSWRLAASPHSSTCATPPPSGTLPTRLAPEGGLCTSSCRAATSGVRRAAGGRRRSAAPRRTT